MRMKDLSPVEQAEAVKHAFAAHGGVLDHVITSMFLELSDRCATLEQQLKEMEGKRR